MRRPIGTVVTHPADESWSLHITRETDATFYVFRTFDGSVEAGEPQEVPSGSLREEIADWIDTVSDIIAMRGEGVSEEEYRANPE